MERMFEALKGGFWTPIEFKDLKKGDKFRAFDVDDLSKYKASVLEDVRYGTVVTDGVRQEWVAASDAYVHDDGSRKRYRIDREE